MDDGRRLETRNLLDFSRRPHCMRNILRDAMSVKTQEQWSVWKNIAIVAAVAVFAIFFIYGIIFGTLALIHKDASNAKAYNAYMRDCIKQNTGKRCNELWEWR